MCGCKQHVRHLSLQYTGLHQASLNFIDTTLYCEGGQTEDHEDHTDSYEDLQVLGYGGRGALPETASRSKKTAPFTATTVRSKLIYPAYTCSPFLTCKMRLMWSCSPSVCVPHATLVCLDQYLWNVIRISREPISTAYFINPAHRVVCLCVHHWATARQEWTKCWRDFFLCGLCRVKGIKVISSSQNLLLDT
jgi:hypothetical protein